MGKIKISATTLPPPHEEMFDYVKELNELPIDYIHCDIMDGKFVSAYTFDYKVVKEIKSLTSLPLDVHLMVEKPQIHIKRYLKAGANIISIHFEAFEKKSKLIKTLLKISKKGALPAIAISPDTNINDVKDVFGYCGLILIMSVFPGKGGQKFIEKSIDKVKQTRATLKEMGLDDVLIEVDGGVNIDNVNALHKAGVDIVAIGNSIYTAKDRVAFLNSIKN